MLDGNFVVSTPSYLRKIMEGCYSSVASATVVASWTAFDTVEHLYFEIRVPSPLRLRGSEDQDPHGRLKDAST